MLQIVYKYVCLVVAESKIETNTTQKNGIMKVGMATFVSALFVVVVV